MNYKNIALIATISNSFCDAILDYSINKYNYYKVLLYSSFIAFIEQLLIGFFKGITFDISAAPYVLIHGIFILAGYIAFVKALQYLPVALVALLETSTVFLAMLIDTSVGYLTITPHFICMFFLFIFAVFLFSYGSFNSSNYSFKKLKKIGFFWSFLTVIFYGLAPYLVKASTAHGADEISINLGYYLLALPYFYKIHTFENGTVSAQKLTGKFYLLCLLIGSLEMIYYVGETFSFTEGTSTIILIIEQMRIFLLYILSVLLKTDKLTKVKVTAIILAFIAVIGVYMK